MKNIVFLFAIIMLNSLGLSSQTEMEQVNYRKFYYENGKLSSEGIIRNEKPDGYWKTYFENGILKSEGNRKNFELDSTWKFYNEEGKLLLEINYSEGKKNGIKRTYAEKEIIEEEFINDVKNGWTNTFYPDHKLKMAVCFVNGMEMGFGKEYAPDGTVITFMEYKKGFMVDRLKINRLDRNNLRQGKWMDFHENGNIRTETDYIKGKKNGYEKEYDKDGKLITVSKYVDDVLQIDAPETRKLEVFKDYFPSGNIRISTTYLEGIPEGIWREYREDGSVEKSYIYKDGKKIAEGIILDDGSKEGPWKDYYPEGSLKAEGNYKAGKITGYWKFYHPEGKLEQEGAYNVNGKLQGTWKWYHENGQLWKEEKYINGLRDGSSEEYDEKGKQIAAGDFLNDYEEGPWFSETGDYREEGNYTDGLKNGDWKFYYLFEDSLQSRKILSYEGQFVEDLPNGRHTSYWPTGKIKEQGEYLMGKKEDDWVFYKEDGSVFLVITYKNGIETRYDGTKIKPPYKTEEK